MVGSPTRYFVLTGLVLHELRWQPYLERLIAFRQRMKNSFGLRLKEEIHAGAMISNPGPLVRIPKNDRLTILRHFADELASMPDLNVIAVIVDKGPRPVGFDPFEMAWKVLIQRFENTISARNFRGPANPDDRGIIFPDRTDDAKLTKLMRRMRRWNPVQNQAYHGMGYRNLLLNTVIEDPHLKDSAHSYFIQAADLTAYLIYQGYAPSSYIRRKGARNYYQRIAPIMCTVASNSHPLGFVRL